MDELKELIAKNLIHFRTMAGLTQLELATKLNYSDKSISKWERGVAVPDVLVLKQLADIYGIKVDDFFNNGEGLNKINIESSLTSKRVLISLMSVGLVWLIATLAFIILLWLNVERSWLCFVVALPVSSIVSIVFSCLWGKTWSTAMVVSLLVWTIALSVHLIFYWTKSALLYLLCIPMQFLVVMWFILMHIIKKKKYQLKELNAEEIKQVQE